MTEPWLTVVGIGADGLAGLSNSARDALAAAEILVGGSRHLALLPDDGRPRLTWRSPLADTLAELLASRPRHVVVVATGDPLWYGVGRLLLRHVPAGEVRVLPHVSAFQEACGRLGWAMEEVLALSTHGRSIACLVRHLQPGRRLLVLTDDGAAPALIGASLVEQGYGASRTWLLEQLSTPAERIHAGSAVTIGSARYADLNLMAIELALSSGRTALSAIPGMPDDAFDHDGQITKAEVRAATLATLAPLDGELLWDVGAGAGSVAIEWLRAGRAMRAVAIERNPARATRIAANAAKLGVPELKVQLGAAPEALINLADAPDAIFVGGGSGVPGLLDRCWVSLRPGGRLVVNAVTIAGEAALLAFHAAQGGKLLRIGLTRSEVIGGQLVWRPALPVTQLTARKPCDAASS